MATSAGVIDVASSRRSLQHRLFWMAGLATLWAVVYAPALAALAGSWFDPSADMQHGAAVPLVVGYIIWSRRDSLLTVPFYGAKYGALIAVAGVLLASISLAAEWIFTIRVGMLTALLGCVVAVFGVRILRPLAYPLLLLAFMVPPPTFAYLAFTFKLQLIASQFAEWTLELLGFSVLREGNILETGGMRWAVAEACSGIRSLITLVFFFLVYSDLCVDRTGMRLALFATLIPLAILGNVFRIVTTVAIGQYDRAMAIGMMHDASAYVVIVSVAAAAMGLHSLLERFTRRRRHGA